MTLNLRTFDGEPAITSTVTIYERNRVIELPSIEDLHIRWRCGWL